MFGSSVPHCNRSLRWCSGPGVLHCIWSLRYGWGPGVPHCIQVCDIAARWCPESEQTGKGVDKEEEEEEYKKKEKERNRTFLKTLTSSPGRSGKKTHINKQIDSGNFCQFGTSGSSHCYLFFCLGNCVFCFFGVMFLNRFGFFSYVFPWKIDPVIVHLFLWHCSCVIFCCKFVQLLRSILRCGYAIGAHNKI